MCRFLAYLGPAVLLETVVSKPCHSLVHQSMHATECKVGTNGDGFGLGWYGERDEPGLYRDLRPAWSDENLQSICAQVRSKLFFAHVRAATGTAIARANCHPFSVGSAMFMHNGQIGGFKTIRRAVEGLIRDPLYPHRAGTTDSEALFLAALGAGAMDDPIAAFSQVLGQACALMQQSGTSEALRFTAAFTDGRTLYAFRWACDAKAPTLYWQHHEGAVHVVSEPLDDAKQNWSAIPQGSVLVVHPGVTPELQPFAITH
jgi:predicted glutamine amidotransferase